MDQLWLAGGLEHDFSSILGIVTPTDELIFFMFIFFYLISKAMKPIYQVHRPVLLP